jgi:hypothetical protein
MRIGAVILIAAIALSCGGFRRQYEYEEELYVSLDGTGTLYVHSSIPALNALRGTAFDDRPNAPVEPDRIREYFTSPIARVTRLTTSRRNTRRFVHVRMDVDDVRRLGHAPPFAWSSYHFASSDDLYVFRQRVGAPHKANPANPANSVNWTGDEIVAFRLHIPSKIAYHNTQQELRGNILVWEQPLTDRLRGVPLEMEARMETQSILYRTLWLFGGTVLAVAVTFAVIIWLVVRRGARRAPQAFGLWALGLGLWALESVRYFHPVG